MCIFIVSLFVYLYVRLYPINVKTAKPIGPKFFVQVQKLKPKDELQERGREAPLKPSLIK